MNTRARFAWLSVFALLSPVAPLSATSLQHPPTPQAQDPALPALGSSAEGRALLGALANAQYHLTPEVKTTYLRYAKAEALREVAAAGKSLPPDFLAWIDSDPAVQTTVYGARQKASNVLLMLRSLELDLGTAVVRKQYTQLALAMAVVEAKNGPSADLTPRQPMKMVIPGDPRHPVNTKATDRPLDVNDHIINFLEDHAPIEGDAFGRYQGPPELKYDENGIAIITTTKTPKGVEKVTRPLVAADVLESRELQDEFNAYMAAHGQSVHIDCGDHIITPGQHAAIHGPNAQGILAAYKLFRTAYEAKGRLPASRDALATPAERCAFLIRNDAYHFPADTAAKRNWPRYPLTAPWPTLTLLAAASEPLREREEIWQRFVDTGEMLTYGEYIGDIAQQFDFQSARRVAPYPFTYGTFQMMVKDGGVCGTMANMGVRTYNALGIPSCTAGQPGHCALISFSYDQKTNTYACRGGQYATGGDDATHPHVNWVFGDTDARRDMVWYQSVAWGVNAGIQSYLDSMVAHDIYEVLPDAERKDHGLVVLASGLDLNPYNFSLVEAAQKLAGTESLQIAFIDHFKSLFASRGEKPGCPVVSLYNTTVQKLADARISDLKPANKDEAVQTLAYLKKEGSSNGRALTVQELAIDGVPAVMDHTREAFTAYIASERTEAESTTMAETIKTVAEQLPGKQQRSAWASELAKLVSNREYFFDAKNHIVYDSSVRELIKLAAYKEQPKEITYGLLRQQLNEAVRASVSGDRDLGQCKKLAARISSLAKTMKDSTTNIAWQGELQKIIAGKETFLPKGAKPKAKPVTDPCAAAIAALSKADA